MADRDGYYCRATQEDDMGQLYLSNIDFLKNGVPASIVATAVSDIRLDVTGVRILNFSAGRCYRWIFPHVGHWVSSSAAHYLFFCVD